MPTTGIAPMNNPQEHYRFDTAALVRPHVPPISGAACLLHHEIAALARLIATTTSALNLWLAGERTRARNIAAYLPPPPRMHLALAPAIHDGAVPSLACALIQDFATSLHLAKALVRAELEGHSINPNCDAAELAHVADVWRKVCDQTIDTLYELNAIVIGEQGTNMQFDDAAVLMMLATARDGGHPNCDHVGLTVPGWADRRQERRYAIDLPARIDAAGLVAAVRICDISRTGLGMCDAPHLDPGAAISVHLPDGRQLQGEVKWSSNSRVGMEFATPLLPEDDLLDPA